MSHITEEDWEEIHSSVSEDVEWIAVDDTASSSSFHTESSVQPAPVAPPSLIEAFVHRIREAESRASAAEERLQQVEEELDSTQGRVLELEEVIENHNRQLLQQAPIRRPKKSSQKLTILPSSSKALKGARPQQALLSKQDYWAKNNHRSHCVGSKRHI